MVLADRAESVIGAGGLVFEATDEQQVADTVAAATAVLDHIGILTKSLALEVSSREVLVNAIAPGPIETPLPVGIDEAWRITKCAELPLGRIGTADEAAPTAVLLASDPGGNLFVWQVLGPTPMT